MVHIYCLLFLAPAQCNGVGAGSCLLLLLPPPRRRAVYRKLVIRSPGLAVGFAVEVVSFKVYPFLSMPQCSVIGCTNPGGHSFPKDKNLQLKWRVALGREDPTHKGNLWTPGGTAVVCYRHFQESDYVQKTGYGTVPALRKLQSGVVPSLHLGKPKTAEQDIPSTKRKERAERRQKKRLCTQTHNVIAEDDGRSPSQLSAVNDFLEHVGAEVTVEGQDVHKPTPMLSSMYRTFQSKSCQTENTGGSVGKQKPQPLLDIDKMSNKQLHHFTGLLCRIRFNCVLTSLGSARFRLNYYNGCIPAISIEHQFLLTLVKLRRYPSNYELTILFDISKKMVSNIVTTWVKFMFMQWKKIDWWPTRENVFVHCPEDFKRHFPRTRVILDGTEVEIQKPKSPAAQRATWSQYKHKNTVKVVVGITPGGLVSFVSPAYGGSASDRQIVERSNFMTMCDPHDEIMVDKGFKVEDLFLPYRIKVNIPSFFKKKNQLSGKLVLSDRKKACKRVHVERIIGLANTYRILSGPLKPSEVELASEIFFVCFTLCNFRPCIVPLTA